MKEILLSEVVVIDGAFSNGKSIAYPSIQKYLDKGYEIKDLKQTLLNDNNIIMVTVCLYCKNVE